ncbi:MAG TPA: TetR/AcrR family transcriptional regulator [Polyangiaceae bacterium]|nr:TetR/AcrR family transcriptional regulator [Polyangiaceae bacterium]
MPRNRRHVDPEKKRDAIVSAARRLFLSEGYEGTGMAKIAARAKIAPNTLYWYFEDKDALLLAVLDELVEEAMADYAVVRAEALDAQLLWLVARFDAVPGLIATVHARIDSSPSIRAWHERFHALVESVMVAQLEARGVPDAERAPAARIASFVVEGLLSHHAPDPGERARIASLLVSRVART